VLVSIMYNLLLVEEGVSKAENLLYLILRCFSAESQKPRARRDA